MQIESYCKACKKVVDLVQRVELSDGVVQDTFVCGHVDVWYVDD